MWLSMFMIATAVAIGLSVTAVVLQSLGKEPVQGRELTGG